MFKIGLTGGIGSGKSTVAKIFEVLDVPVYDSDAAARLLMNTDLDLKEQILHHFGEAAYVDGQLNRSYLAGQVFNNPEKLALLNSLLGRHSAPRGRYLSLDRRSSSKPEWEAWSRGLFWRTGLIPLKALSCCLTHNIVAGV